MRKIKLLLEMLLLVGIIFISPLAYVTVITMDEEIDNRIPDEYFEVGQTYKDSINLFKIK